LRSSSALSNQPLRSRVSLPLATLAFQVAFLGWTFNSERGLDGRVSLHFRSRFDRRTGYGDVRLHFCGWFYRSTGRGLSWQFCRPSYRRSGSRNWEDRQLSGWIWSYACPVGALGQARSLRQDTQSWSRSRRRISDPPRARPSPQAASSELSTVVPANDQLRSELAGRPQRQTPNPCKAGERNDLWSI
jgi:hypothetical protein